MRLLDKAARHYLGMSGGEFLARWDAGEYSESLESVLDVAVLVPLVRPPDADESPSEFFERLTSRYGYDHAGMGQVILSRAGRCSSMETSARGLPSLPTT
jgi:hypothetical protein